MRSTGKTKIITLKIVFVLSALNGLGILLQWLLIWLDYITIEDKVPGFRNYFILCMAMDNVK